MVVNNFSAELLKNEGEGEESDVSVRGKDVEGPRGRGKEGDEGKV